MVQLWLGSHGGEGQDGLLVPVRRIIVRPDYQAPTCARWRNNESSKQLVFLFTAVFGVQTGLSGRTES